MSVEILNSITVMEFVEDTEAFDKFVNEQFVVLDVNGDGVISRSELREGINSLLTLGSESGSKEEMNGLHDIVFEKFDCDHSGTIDQEEFRSGIKMMFAVARGIGDSPVSMALEGNSFLMKAVKHELTKRQ